MNQRDQEIEIINSSYIFFQRVFFAQINFVIYVRNNQQNVNSLNSLAV